MELTGWKPVTLRKELFESFRGVDLNQSLGKYPGAFLTVRGSDDYLRTPSAPPPKMTMVGSSLTIENPHTSVDPDDNFLQIAPSDEKMKLIVKGADHIFHVFDGEKGQARQEIDIRIDWFERTL